eukprot:15453292-Alexandrium_andersonii.AAC.1
MASCFAACRCAIHGMEMCLLVVGMGSGFATEAITKQLRLGSAALTACVCPVLCSEHHSHVVGRCLLSGAIQRTA